MGYAARANGIALAAKRGTIKPYVKPLSEAAQRDAARVKAPMILWVLKLLGAQVRLPPVRRKDLVGVDLGHGQDRTVVTPVP